MAEWSNDSGLTNISGLDVHCENCGRRKRFSYRHVAEWERQGHRSIEAIGQRFKCQVCSDAGLRNRNISVIPYYRRQGPAQARRA